MSLQPALPQSIFPLRESLATPKQGVYEINQLNLGFPLTQPMRWNPEELCRGTHLELLTLHYMEYLEAVPWELGRDLILDWVEASRPYDARYWMGSWNSYALSIRCVIWMQWLARHQERISTHEKEVIGTSLVRQLRFLRANVERDILGNHLIRNIKCLLWAGRFFDDAEAEEWTRLGSKLLAEQLAEQILSDGFHFELSPAYHTQVFCDLLETFSVLSESRLRDELETQLLRMAQVVADTAHQDGFTSLFGDGGLSMAYAPAQSLRAHETLTGSQTTERKHIEFPKAGYYGWRSKGDLLLFDCGRIGADYLPAHGHGDVLAFEWTLDGLRFCVDAGVFEYHSGERRDYSRSTTSHNTVTVGNEDQCEFWKSFRVGQRPNVDCEQVSFSETGMKITASHDGYGRLEQGLIHRRKLEVSETRLHVQDEILGGSGQIVVARVLFHPECQFEVTSTGCTVTREDVVVQIETNHPWSLRECTWHPDFGTTLATQQIVVEYGKSPCQGSFHLVVVNRNKKTGKFDAIEVR